MKISFIILFGIAFSFPAVLSSNPAFTYEVDDQYKRPILRLPVPSDENDDKPRDVLISFLDSIRLKKYDAAASLCYFGWRLGDGSQESWETIEGEPFISICDEINSSIKEITISGSTVRQKSYYSIWCRITTHDNKQADLNVYLIRVDDIWKVRETSVSKFRYQLDKLKSNPDAAHPKQ